MRLVIFCCELSFLDPHNSFLSKSITRIVIFIILIINNRGHGMHLSESEHILRNVVIVELLVIYSVNLIIRVRSNIDLEYRPF